MRSTHIRLLCSATSGALGSAIQAFSRTHSVNFKELLCRNNPMLTYRRSSTQVTALNNSNFMDTPPRVARRNPIRDATSARHGGLTRPTGVRS